MKIGLDVRMIDHSGIGTTISEFLNHLDEKKQRKMVLFSKPHWRNPFASHQVQVPYPIYTIRQHFFYPSLLQKEKLTFFHMPHFDVPYFYQGPFVSTVYDLIHLLFPQFSNKPMAACYARFMLKYVSEKARRIIVISENTKKDLVKYFPMAEEKIRVIYPGVTRDFDSVQGPLQQGDLRDLKLEGEYLLSIGNLRGSKNTKGLIEAYGKARRSRGKTFPTLVIAGKNFLPEYEKGFPAGIHYLGVVDQKYLKALYAGALGFLFPSYYEGFGLPPLEAMVCGTPVLTSNQGALPEVCADAALYVDPYSQEDMASKIVRLAGDAALRRDLVAKGEKNIERFHWKNFADKIWNLYEDVQHELINR